ncbi:hypothetical protein M316_0138 [Nitrincola phage 1M3-16]|uniref:hypothetical protein n=1 Tax=Nitrincola phage 1M3-16 TaxID=1472912 RepID=UPI000444E8B7|nr:hypothetical protein GJ22_gp014 [Nitrincola phage 1M3-16]AHX01203.1 hypothetical protein M316_0138 [Nitrincola phage 1M3-16]
MNIQRLRNLTTGRLHTEMSHIYQDLEWITGQRGLMTRMLPRACTAVEPWLKKYVKDDRFWNGEWDTEHVGEIDLPTPTEEDRAEMLKIYMELPCPFGGE